MQIGKLKMLSGALVFAIVLSLCCISVTASKEDGLCEHHPKHTEECGYTEEKPDDSCEFVCDICKEETKDIKSSDLTVVSWNWEGDSLILDEQTGVWGLGIPGASKENPVTRDLLAGMLPEKIKAEMSDGTEKELSLTWNLEEFPKKGAYEGSYTLKAEMPKDYALGDKAPALKVTAELGGGEIYADKKKYVNGWSYVSRGGSEISESNFQYSMDYYLAITSDRDLLIQKMKSVLPTQIKCWGFYSQELVDAGFTLAPDEVPSGKPYGYVRIDWGDIEEVVDKAGGIKDNTSLTFEAKPVSNPGYEICVNSNNTSLPDGNDTSQVEGILNLTITLHELHLEEHTVTSANPLNTTVNLFDYWVDKDGAKGDDDLLGKSDTSHDSRGRGHTGVSDWNKGINQGRLMIFGDGNIHAGYWNKGAGAMSDYGKAKAGMSGMVKPVLEEGYPVLDEAEMEKSIDGYEGIGRWDLCGDHEDGNPASVNQKNISNTVINNWKASGNSASLDYLFDPKIEIGNKRQHEDVKGLFQIDNNGYYYYDMRKNFAEYDKDDNRFVLYDAPAVDRTDKSYENGGFTGGRSIGNFLPFNTGAQVFDLVEGKNLSNSESITSSNLTTAAEYMNHHLGMTVNVDFRQPLNGVVNTGKTGNTPMSFQFSGDDDVWIFIDDVLVLDMGGIHSEIYGTIDFSDGKISVGQSWKTNGFPYKSDGTVDVDKLHENAVQTTTLKEQFKKAGKEDATLWRGNTFASNTSHTLKMFYLERGNYDSSLALRFNLQPLLYQQLKKVDQDGKPLGGVEFDLYSAEETTADASGAIKCLYTDNAVNYGEEFYVKQKEGSSFVHLTTASDGSARFLDEDGNYFNFADHGRKCYILKETKTPDGYRTLPVDIVLYYDSDTSMLSVANRWTTGAYACSVMHNTGTGRITYGYFNETTGNIEQDPTKEVSSKKQRDGLAVAIPMLQRRSDKMWEALYGSNLSGFKASTVRSDAAVELWRDAVLRAVLEQAADTDCPDWNLSWDNENFRLVGTLDDLPGLANRYQVVNPDGDMKIIYGIIEPKALQEMGISGDDAKARYKALGDYVKKNGTEKTLETIMSVTVDGTGSGRGFSFLNAGQLTRDFRSLIYIPNERRELWVMKIDQDGKPYNGAEFGLYSNEACTGEPVARGTTATINGQKGTLIFSPSDDKSEGHAQMMWASYARTRYYLKELSAPEGCTLNSTVVPVVVGSHSIYADAGTREDGVSVMAGVGRLTQTMKQYAMNSDVDITLQDITAIQQRQPSENKEVLAKDWKDAVLEETAGVWRSINLHYGKNAVVDYGLHDEDGGKLYKPFFVSDTGFVRARVKQNYEALTTPMYENSKLDANKDDLGNTDLTNLFSLLNIVVVTDQTIEDTNTGKLVVSKMLKGPNLDKKDYIKNFTFKIKLTDKNGKELTGDYYFYGTDKAGYVSSGKVFPLHHDESITILGLPEGAKYTVTETSVEGWYPLPKEGMTEGDAIKDATAFAPFYNSKEPWPEVGFLLVHKTVAGKGDRTKGFTFDITLSNEDGTPLEGEFSYDGDKKGKISSGQSVTLRHDEYITIYDLPAGTKYTVSEKEADQDGYTTTAHGGKGDIQDGDLDQALFTNTIGKDTPVTNPPEPEPPVTDPPNRPGTDTEENPGGGIEEGSSSGKTLTGILPKTGDPITIVGTLAALSLSGVGVAASTFRKNMGNRHRGRLLQLRKRRLRRRRRKMFFRKFRKLFLKR